MKNKRTKLKLFVAVLLACSMVFKNDAYAVDMLPYTTYNYDYRENVVLTPAAYVPEASISGVNLGIGTFSNPQGMCVDKDGLIYIADSGNNRIVALNQEMNEVIRIIDSFDNNGVIDTFNIPTGVTVSEKNQLFIADSENKRIVVLENEELVRIVSEPQSEILAEDYVFTPLKLAVDYADRIYCVARGMFQGIMVFESNGDFTGFFGTIKVKISPWEIFWRRFSTKEERQKQLLFIPTEFTGIDVDKDGFVYASNIDIEGKQAVRRLNPKGEDVIKKGVNKNVGGDLVPGGMMSLYSGPSNIIDVVVREKGIYSLLDSKRGRVITYDHEGNILYIFGGLGSQAGTFRTPVAIETVGEKVLVLDSYRAEILTFTETDYGALINEAVGLRFDGDEALAVEKWKQVLKYDENFELANTGIGKSYLTAGENKLAMKYLKIGMNRDYYSVAFKRYRNEVLQDNLSYILSGVVLLVTARFVFVRFKKRKLEQDDGGAWVD